MISGEKNVTSHLRAFILWVAFAVGEGAYWIGSSPNTVVRSISRGEFWS
jgi:hypothetical protein